MNLKLPSKLGAEPKKVVILGGLVVLAVYLLWPGGGGSSSGTPRPGTTPATPLSIPSGPRTYARLRGRGREGAQRTASDFRPSLKIRDEHIDRSLIDPTLHTDLLDRLQSVRIEGGTRSLFDFGEAPPTPAALAKIKEPAKIIPRPLGPMPAPSAQEASNAKPPPPPIPLRFYGFVNTSKSGVKRAFFLDGEDIIMAAEGQMVKNRYKIVRIGVNSAVVEDTVADHHQQTLPLVEEVTG